MFRWQGADRSVWGATRQRRVRPEGQKREERMFLTNSLLPRSSNGLCQSKRNFLYRNHGCVGLKRRRLANF